MRKSIIQGGTTQTVGYVQTHHMVPKFCDRTASLCSSKKNSALSNVRQKQGVCVCVCVCVCVRAHVCVHACVILLAS